MNPQVDLSNLVVERPAAGQRQVRRPRRLVSRYVLPGAILLGFVAVGAWAARDALWRPTPVTVTPVLATRGEVQQAGTALFSSAGWIEPRPTPVQVTALAEGVVERLLVVENQAVDKGDPVAELVDADAKLALRQAQAELELRAAEVQTAEAALAAAEKNLEFPLQLQAAAAEAEAALAKASGEHDVLPQHIKAAEAKFKLAEQELAGKQSAGTAVSARAMQRAESELLTARAAVDEYRAKHAQLEAEVKALRQKSAALAEQLKLKVAETQALASAKAMLAAAQARRRQAEVAADTAQLRLDRTTVHAPIDGRVLALVARPGARLMGLTTDGAPDAATVVTMYDPAMLQVRADVRLDDVGRVLPGGEVRITTAALKEPLHGKVLFATATADIQKNTLSVKVAIDDPPPVVKPEMLVQVTFLAPPTPAGAETATARLRLLVPRQLVESDGASGDGTSGKVWIADGSGSAVVARHKSVTLAAGEGELVEVTAGLTAADKLIVQGREGLREGERIAITGEDRSVGSNAPQSTGRASGTPKDEHPQKTSHAKE